MIDLLLLVFVIAGFWLGYTKGIVVTLFSVLSYVVTFLITITFSPWLSGLLIRLFHMNHLLALALGTLIFFIAAIFLFKWLGKRVEIFFKKGKSGRFAKVLGGIVMMFVGIIFYSFLLWLINSFGLIGEKLKLASIGYETLEAIPTKARAIVEEFKPLFRRYWELMQESIRERQSTTPG